MESWNRRGGGNPADLGRGICDHDDHGSGFDRITLGALIISLGLLVDDAIIAIESMVVKMEEGMDRIRAAAYAWSTPQRPCLPGRW